MRVGLYCQGYGNLPLIFKPWPAVRAPAYGYKWQSVNSVSMEEENYAKIGESRIAMGTIFIHKWKSQVQKH